MTEEEKQTNKSFESDAIHASDAEDLNGDAEKQAPQESKTIAERRVHAFKLHAGKEIEEIPEYTLANEDPKKIRTKRRRSAWIRVTLGIVIVALTGLLSYGILFGVQDMSGFGKADSAVTIEIPQNAGTEKVASILEEAGIVKAGMLFRVD